MAIKSRMPASGAIEKAIQALNDGLDISGAGTEVQYRIKKLTLSLMLKLLNYQMAELK